MVSSFIMFGEEIIKRCYYRLDGGRVYIKAYFASIGITQLRHALRIVRLEALTRFAAALYR
jgi:hypothetical protein